MREAAFAGTAVMSHAQATEGIKEAVRCGVRSIEHGIYLDDEAIELMLKNGTYLCPTLLAPQSVLEAGRAEATHFMTQGLVSVARIIGPPWQGRGHASEAVAAMVEWLKGLKVGIIHAFIHPGHVASEGVARRVGFTVTDQVEDGERRWILASDQSITAAVRP